MYVHAFHHLTVKEITFIQVELLKWYEINQRKLLWRTLRRSDHISLQDKAYLVLISEIMLQQTQARTVEKYYKKWIEKWPTLQHLSLATLEEVNEMWAGLGYYARAHRLLKFSQIIVNKFDCKIPTDLRELNKLPGIGEYTAGAIASIVFNKKVPAIDGNAIRVITRVCAIGGLSNNKTVRKSIWDIGTQLVPDNSGDFNEAIMDFASSVCTVKNPKCEKCPLKEICKAYKRTKENIVDIEECELCFTNNMYQINLGVMNYPQKIKKNPPKLKYLNVFVIFKKVNSEIKLFLVQRNSTGLLAGLWEFPSFDINESFTLSLPHHKNYKKVKYQLKTSCNVTKINQLSYLGNITHTFSHIKWHCSVFSVHVDRRNHVKCPSSNPDSKWVSNHLFWELAIPTGMKKMYSLFIKDFDKMQHKKRNMK